MTVKVCPAIVTVPVLAEPVFAWIESVTVPFPLPLLPLVTPIHSKVLTAVRLQPVAPVTFTVMFPPELSTD